MYRAPFATLAFALTLAACGSPNVSDTTPPQGEEGSKDDQQRTIKVLSNRPDLISEGDALIELVPQGDSKDFRLTLNGADVSDQVALRDNGRIMGVVSGLSLGDNRLAVSGGVGTASITITNHPNHGPVFSAGQHRLTDWEVCEAGGTSEHNDCNRAPEYRFFYKSSNPLQTDLIQFDPANGIPSDVANTTTDEGITVPFIVREERGFQDRDRYMLAVLFNPAEEWTAWNPQPQWNRKMLMTHGANCGMSFSPGDASLATGAHSAPLLPPVGEHGFALSRGFGVMATALNNNGHNCDVVLQAESMMMAKERLIEQYGELRYTIGVGCSGGAIAQQTVANAYPGIYQGIMTACTYPDSVSPAVQAADYNLMRHYFEDPSQWAPGVIWSPHQFGLVEGHISHVNAIAMDELLYKAAVNVEGGCAGADTYHPQNNPEGVRCGAIEWYKHIWGTQTVDSKSEPSIPIEVTNIPAGNTGIMYGLETVLTGQITPAQFVDLNQKIGGFDFDMKWQPERTSTTAEIVGSAFRSGAGNVTNNLDRVAVLNFLGPDPGAAHDSVHAFWTRWRMDREHGHHDNHIMWAGPVALLGDPYYNSQGLVAMDAWLAAVEADNSDTPLAEKLVNNKPADMHDQCTDGLGHKIGDEVCVELLRIPYAYGTPRTVAGANENATNYECQLKSFSRDDLASSPIPFTEDQFVALETLFADGVCDYSLLGVGEDVKTIPWLNYQNGDGQRGVIVGGEPLPAADLPKGWASPAFGDMWDFSNQ